MPSPCICDSAARRERNLCTSPNPAVAPVGVAVFVGPERCLFGSRREGGSDLSQNGMCMCMCIYICIYIYISLSLSSRNDGPGLRNRRPGTAVRVRHLGNSQATCQGMTASLTALLLRSLFSSYHRRDIYQIMGFLNDGSLGEFLDSNLVEFAIGSWGHSAAWRPVLNFDGALQALL